MATLEQFKKVRASVSPEVQTELYGLLVQDLDAAVLKMIAIAGDDMVLQLLGMNTDRNAPSPSCKVQKLLWGSVRTEFFWSSDQAHPSLKKVDAYRSLGVSLWLRVRIRIPFTRRLTLSLTVRGSNQKKKNADA